MSVLGIDIGSTNCVVATVARGAVSIIRNELSERQTPSLVSFTEDRRLLGDIAAAQLMSNYKNTCRNIKNLLGRFMDDPEISNEAQYSLCDLAEAENGLIGYKVKYKGELRVFSATRILAALLSKLKSIAEKSLERSVTEVVVACPGWFTDVHRSAMLKATEIAGLKCLRVFGEHVATALDYGIYRLSHFSDAEPIRVAFVSMGHCNTSVSIVEFTKEKLQVLAEVGDRTLGGRNMDMLLARHFTTNFVKSGLDPFKNVKARLKIEEQCSKARKILSANNEAVCNIECLMEDEDLYSTIDRDTFNALCKKSLVPQLQALMRKAMSTCDLSADRIHSVEVVGGCTRIPWVQNEISAFFGKEVSRTLSADECIARGCALQAAMCSAHFKVREFGCHERLSHPISITWSGLDNYKKSEDPKECFSGNAQTVLLMPVGMNTNQRKKLRVKRSSPFVIHAFYANPADLPPGTPESLGTCIVNVPDTKGVSMETMVHVTLNFHGQFKFVSAYMKEPVEDAASSETQPEEIQETQNGGGEQGEEGSKDGAISKEATSKEKSYKKVEVGFTIHEYRGKYTTNQTTEFLEAEMGMNFDDKQQMERLDKMNEVESLIFSTQEKLRGEWSAFAYENEKKQIFQILNEIETWLFDNMNAQKELLDQKLLEIHTACKAVTDRFNVLKEFHEYREYLAQMIQKCNEAISVAGEKYAHVPYEKKQELETMVGTAEIYLAQVVPPDSLQPNLSDIEFLKSGFRNLSGAYNSFISTPVPPPVTPTEPVGEAPENGGDEAGDSAVVEEPMDTEE